MEHIHLKECESTQDFALELLNSKENFVISCEKQTKGRGQGTKTWDSLGNCISFSFDLKPCELISLTSLEVGVLVCMFFEKFYNITPKLKWPNDILNQENQKCGGILINNPAKSNMIAGIGINLSSNDELIIDEYKVPAGFIFSQYIEINKKQICYNIAQFIHKNRLSNLNIIDEWNSRCAHMNQTVLIFDDQQETSGIFRGIGKNGQALIEVEKDLRDFYSGSLKLLN